MSQSGILTHSGRFVPLESGDVPSIQDIAIALSRIPRFAGHCRRPWYVLDHCLHVHAIAADYAEKHTDSPLQSRLLRLVALLHDAHEALTGDIPTPFKTADMRRLQQALDVRIWDRYVPGGKYMAQVFQDDVAKCDRRALLAEALVVGPPALQTPEDCITHLGAAPSKADVRRMQELLLTRDASFDRFRSLYNELH